MIYNTKNTVLTPKGISNIVAVDPSWDEHWCEINNSSSVWKEKNENITPINLTEEVLKKVGGEYIKQNNTFCLHIDNEKHLILYQYVKGLWELSVNSISSKLDYDINILTSELEHLHQLQDWYAVFNNKEKHLEYNG